MRFYSMQEVEEYSIQCGEKKLLVAILKRAVLDYCSGNTEEADQARDWIFQDLDSSKFREFTFPWVCEHLGLNHRQVATEIQRIESDEGFEEVRRVLPRMR